VLDDGCSAEAGTPVLRALHDGGEITRHVFGVVAGDATGKIRIEQGVDPTSMGTGTGTGLDLVPEADGRLRPGKVAVIAEVDEDRVAMVNASTEAIGGVGHRGARADVASIEKALQQATGDTKKRLQNKANSGTAPPEGGLEQARGLAKPALSV